MDDHALLPWMLRRDWREDSRAWLTLDLSGWPAEAALDPMPPVPVIAFGPPDHPRAGEADILLEDGILLPALTRGIAAAPHASAAAAALLRATQHLPATQAFVPESFAFAMLQGSAEHAAWLAGRPPAPALPPGRLHMRRAGAVLHLRLDRPAAHNAIDRAMRDALFEAFCLAALDSSITKVRLRGAGRSFCLGAELAEFGTTRDPAAAHAIRARTLPTMAMARRPEIYDIHVQGGCVGAGLEMAAFAHRLTAAPDAWFHLPETAMGILPGFGGCVSLPRRIGRQRACALILSGKRISARRALAWGLIDAIMNEPPADEGGAHEAGG